MDTMTSDTDLDLIDISNWSTSDSDQFKLFDGRSLVHNADDVSQFTNDEFEMQNDNDTIITSRSVSGNNILSTVNVRKISNPPTITTIYEPKFLEIFHSYRQFASNYEPNIDLNSPSQQHLMTLCLNNLLPFCNWARETTTSSFIRATLFDNSDMRPEVRNGLALILVYTFSAAKAADEAEIAANSKPVAVQSSGKGNNKDNIDMFTVLMKHDTGMGITNKTSLKMYSDPLGFFGFIKNCISGLIDAAGIPENERQNIQQSKKSRRGSKNKDEVQAYSYMKDSLVAMFQNSSSASGSGETIQLAKNKIKQINEFWDVNSKTIRYEKFIKVFSLPTPSNSNRTSGAATQVNAAAPGHNSSSGNLTMASVSGSGSSGNVMGGIGGMGNNSDNDSTRNTSVNNSAANSANVSGLGMNAFPGMTQAQQQYQQQQLQQRLAGLAATNNNNNNNSHNRLSGRERESSDGGNGGLTVDTSQFQQQHQPQQHHNNGVRTERNLSNNSNNGYNIYQDHESDTMSSASRSPHPGSYGADPSFILHQQQQQQSAAKYFNQNPSGLIIPNPPLYSGSNQNSPVVGHHHSFNGPGSASKSPFPPPGSGNSAHMSSPTVPHQHSHLQQQQHHYNASPAPVAPSVPVPSIRYDRTGSSKWVANSTLLYDLDSLQSSMAGQASGSYFLVDEVKLKAFLEEATGVASGADNILSPHSAMSSDSIATNATTAAAAAVTTPCDILLSQYMLSSGVNTLEKVLQRSGALVTGWNRLDVAQFKVFVESWRQEQLKHAADTAAATSAATAAAMALESSAGGDRGVTRSRQSSIDSMGCNASVLGPDPFGRRPVRRRTTGAIDIRRDIARLQEMAESEGEYVNTRISSMHIDTVSSTDTADATSHHQGNNNTFHQQQQQQQGQPGGCDALEEMATDHSSNDTEFHPNMFQYSTMAAQLGQPTGSAPSLQAPAPPVVTPSAGNLKNIFGSVTPQLQQQQQQFASLPIAPSPPPLQQRLSNSRRMSPAISLLEFWHSLTSGGGVVSCSNTAHTAATEGVAVGAATARGVIVYERSLEVGLIVRANPALQINEDAWCLFYPEDIQYTPPSSAHGQPQPQSQQSMQDLSSTTFAALIVHLLPQTRSLMGLIAPPQQPRQQDGSNNSDQQLRLAVPGSGRMMQRKSNTFSAQDSLRQFQLSQLGNNFDRSDSNDAADSPQQYQQQPVQQQQQQPAFGGGFGAKFPSSTQQPQQNIITLSYYSHKIDAFSGSSSTANANAQQQHYMHFGHQQQQQSQQMKPHSLSDGPPQAPPGNFYRTVGTLDSQYHVVTSKFQEDAVFHDIMLR